MVLTGVFPAQAQGQFEVPCQTREAFVSRLRALVQAPDAADVELSAFAVEARETAPANWLINVRKVGDESAARVLRDTSCDAVAEVGALVVALWINELAAARAEKPAPQAQPAAAVPHMIVVDPPWEATVGVSLLTDASMVLFRPQPAGGLGSTLSVWLQDMNKGYLQLGVRVWPTALRLHPNQENLHDQRGTWELLLGVGGWVPVAEKFAIGGYINIAMGARAFDSDGDTAIRPDFGLLVRMQLARAFYLRFQIGPAVFKDPVRLSLTSALGLDVLAFDI